MLILRELSNTHLMKMNLQRENQRWRDRVGKGMRLSQEQNRMKHFCELFVMVLIRMFQDTKIDQEESTKLSLFDFKLLLRY